MSEAREYLNTSDEYVSDILRLGCQSHRGSLSNQL